MRAKIPSSSPIYLLNVEPSHYGLSRQILRDEIQRRHDAGLARAVGPELQRAWRAGEGDRLRLNIAERSLVPELRCACVCVWGGGGGGVVAGAK